MNDPSLVILAAGMGSRYGGLKQTEPVGPHGELLIEYSIFDALAEGFRHIVFIIRRDQEDAFREVLGEKLAGRCSVSFAYQELTDLPAGWSVPAGRIKPWGTAHAVLSCRDMVQDSFAVMNADDYYGRESFARIAESLDHGEISPGEFALVGFDLVSTLTTHGAVSRGVCSVDVDGYLEQITERTQVTLHNEAPVYRNQLGDMQSLAGDVIASMNLWAFPDTFMETLEKLFPRFLKSARSDEVQDEYFLPAVVGDLVSARRARVRVLRTTSNWMGVTYREDMPYVRDRIRRLIGSGQYPPRLWNAAS